MLCHMQGNGVPVFSPLRHAYTPEALALRQSACFPIRLVISCAIILQNPTIQLGPRLVKVPSGDTNKKRTWHPPSYDDAKKRRSATLRIHPWLHASEALQAGAYPYKVRKVRTHPPV